MIGTPPVNCRISATTAQFLPPTLQPPKKRRWVTFAHRQNHRARGYRHMTDGSKACAGSTVPESKSYQNIVCMYMFICMYNIRKVIVGVVCSIFWSVPKLMYVCLVIHSRVIMNSQFHRAAGFILIRWIHLTTNFHHLDHLPKLSRHVVFKSRELWERLWGSLSEHFVPESESLRWGWVKTYEVTI